MKQRYVYIHINRWTSGVINVFGTMKRAHNELKQSPFCLKCYARFEHQLYYYGSYDVDNDTKIIKQPIY